MEIRTTKARLKKMVPVNVGNTIKELDRLLDPNRAATFNTFLVLSGEFNAIRQQDLNGNESIDTIQRLQNNFATRFLSFIDSLQETDLLRVEWLQDLIYEKIVVVSKSRERMEYMQKLFPLEYFRAVNFDYSQDEIAVNEIDILVYDGYPSHEGEDDELLRYFIEDTLPVVLYFGPFTKLLQKYPEKVYATNSVFSLHARINEMITYLKYRNAYQGQL